MGLRMGRSSALPSRSGAVVFAVKKGVLQARRALEDALAPVPRHPKADAGAYPFLAAESITPLWVEMAEEESANEAGKVQNLRVAALRLDGTGIAAGSVFSFWRQVGRTSRSKGYAYGRMLQQGCLIPSRGGGAVPVVERVVRCGAAGWLRGGGTACAFASYSGISCVGWTGCDGGVELCGSAVSSVHELVA